MITRRLALLLFATLLLSPCAQLSQAGSQQSKAATKKTSKPAAKRAARRTAPVPAAQGPRAQKLLKAQAASSDMRPLAEELRRTRSAAAFAAMEEYAQRQAGQPAEGLAWFVVGYARLLEQQPVAAIPALRKAQPVAGELADYVTYYLAKAHADSAQHKETSVLLAGFSEKHAGSLLRREAALLHAASLMSLEQPGRALNVLAPFRGPGQAAVEMALGRAYVRSGELVKAGEAFRRVYFEMPETPQADEAEGAIELLKRRTALPAPTYAQRKTRAERLAARRRNADAAKEFRETLRLAPAHEVAPLQMELGVALYRARKEREARAVLEKLQPSTAEMNARRLYYLLEIARPDSERVEELLKDLEKAAPKSSWYQEAILSTANLYLLRREYDAAAPHYLSIPKKFPSGSRAGYGHWKGAWLTFRLGRMKEARELFDQHVELYPESSEVPAALYWRGRVSEEMQDRASAQLYYRKLADRFGSNYYAELGRERLQELKPEGELKPAALLEKIPPAPRGRQIKLEEPPAGNIRVQKSRLLQNGALYELALRELEVAAADPGPNWATAELVRLYQQTGRYDRAMRVLKRAVSGYFSMGDDQMPREFWEALFPRAYWAELERYSRENGLDPYLVAALIRQESEFHPGAVSPARAVGLMQLLPSTGGKTARAIKLRGYTAARLTDPATNLQLGTHYLRAQIDSLDGVLEYALAAYNAGPHRVKAWREDGPFRDIYEFVESIPFTETREYVKAVRRNVAVYRRLYGDALETQTAHCGPEQAESPACAGN